MTEDQLEFVLKFQAQGLQMFPQIAGHLKQLRNHLDQVTKATGGAGGLIGMLGRVGGLLRAGAGGIGGVFLSFAQTAIGAVGGIIGKVGELARWLASTLVGAIQTAGKALIALGAAGAATMALIANKGVRFNAGMEQLATSFEVLLGSPQKAKEMLSFLKDFADKTAFVMPEVAKAGKILTSFGLDVATWLEPAGNLAAGFAAGIDEVAVALGRLNAGDSGEALERLRDWGISKPKLTARGVKFASNGQLETDAKTTLAAIRDIIESEMGGMMSKQSQTLSGLFSTLTDKWDSFLGAITSGLSGRLRAGIGQLLEFLDRLQSTETWGKVIAALSLPFDLLGGAFQWIISQVPALTNALAEGFSSGAIQTAIMTLADWLLTAFRNVGGVVSGVLAVLSNGLGADLVKAAKLAWQGIHELAVNTVGAVDAMVQALAGMMQSFLAFDAVLAGRLSVWARAFGLPTAGYHEKNLELDQQMQDALQKAQIASHGLLTGLQKGILSGHFSAGQMGLDFGQYGQIFQSAMDAFGQKVPTAEGLLALMSGAGATPTAAGPSAAPAPVMVGGANQNFNVSVSLPGATVNAPGEIASQAASMAYDATMDALAQAANGTTASPIFTAAPGAWRPYGPEGGRIWRSKPTPPGPGNSRHPFPEPVDPRNGLERYGPEEPEPYGPAY